MNQLKLLTPAEFKAVRDYIKTLNGHQQAMLEPLINHVLFLTAPKPPVAKPKLKVLDGYIYSLPKEIEARIITMMDEGLAATLEFKRLLDSIKITNAEAVELYRARKRYE